ncbi:MAG: hypothetical protein ABFD00_09465 [Chloroherpetonaceae bacterium]
MYSITWLFFQGDNSTISNDQFWKGLSFIFSLYVFLWIYHIISKYDSNEQFRQAIKGFINVDILGNDPEKKSDENDWIVYDSIASEKAFKTILQLRDVDNKLMWNRINLLLVFQGVLIAAVAAGIGELSAEKYSLFFAAIIFFGFFSSLMLFYIARGGSWWVSHWEQHLAKIERNVFGELDIFREHISARPDLKKIWKRQGYVSTRDTIIFFTSLFPLVWAIIFLIFITGTPQTPSENINLCCNLSCNLMK